jgi:hypothetical protein
MLKEAAKTSVWDRQCRELGLEESNETRLDLLTRLARI